MAKLIITFRAGSKRQIESPNLQQTRALNDWEGVPKWPVREGDPQNDQLGEAMFRLSKVN